jgi:hypothetical protein
LHRGDDRQRSRRRSGPEGRELVNSLIQQCPNCPLLLEDLIVALATLDDRPALEIIEAMRQAPGKEKLSTLAG